LKPLIYRAFVAALLLAAAQALAQPAAVVEGVQMPAWVERAGAAGYAAGVRPLRHGGQLVYIVRIRNLPSRAEAQALAGQLRGRYGVENPTVSG